MNKIRFGILSTAKIGLTQIIPGMKKSMHCEVTAISSRSKESATIAAESLSIPKAYASYEEILTDPDIDAVYIPLPNHLHVPWAIKALQAGKHVLCEKPLALSAKEARSLLDEAEAHPKLKIMEGFMYRHHPQWAKTLELVMDGAIGELTAVQTLFSYYNDKPDNIRNKTDLGGGGLMDIGCYAISLSRFLFGSEPDRVVGFANSDPKFGTDRIFSGMMDFGGKIASFTCSTQAAQFQRVNMLGTTGRIELLIPFNPPADKASRILLQDDTTGSLEEIDFDPCDQYTIQADQFALAVLNNTNVPTPLEDALANMHVLETLAQSANNGQWERC